MAANRALQQQRFTIGIQEEADENLREKLNFPVTQFLKTVVRERKDENFHVAQTNRLDINMKALTVASPTPATATDQPPASPIHDDPESK